jgi:hypothetical protein
MKKALSKRQSAVLEVMSKPKIPAEIRNQIGLKRTNNLSAAIKELVNAGLIHCLNPSARVGRLYGLTKKGISTRKKLGFKEYCQPHDIDWDLYGYIVSGRQRRTIMKAMSENIPMTSRLIRERANEYNSRISRTNANDILQQFVRKKLTKKRRKGNSVHWILMNNGQRIKNQLSKP